MTEEEKCKCNWTSIVNDKEVHCQLPENHKGNHIGMTYEALKKKEAKP